jgi:hypothetical protein
MSDKDGGPAFPGQPRDTFASNLPPGMSLRDWFAGQALVGMLASPLITSNRESYAQWAYLQADAMLAERAK